MKKKASSKRPKTLPLLAVRDVVFFPHMTLPLSVGRKRSVLALEEAMRKDHLLLVVSQKKAGLNDPKVKDLYRWGVLGEVIQFLKMPDGTLKVFLQGLKLLGDALFRPGTRDSTEVFANNPEAAPHTVDVLGCCAGRCILDTKPMHIGVLVGVALVVRCAGVVPGSVKCIKGHKDLVALELLQ